MLYHEDFKINYWLPPRAASRMTKEILVKVGFQGFTPNYHDLVIYNSNWDLYVNVRNPYSFYVSSYLMQKKEELSFEDYLKSRHSEDFHTKIENHWDVGQSLDRLNIKPTKLIKYENFKEEILNLFFVKCNELNLDQEIYKLNLGKQPWREGYTNISNNPYFTFYNQELADIVWERKQKSFELLGYERDSWKYIIE